MHRDGSAPVRRVPSSSERKAETATRAMTDIVSRRRRGVSRYRAARYRRGASAAFALSRGSRGSVGDTSARVPRRVVRTPPTCAYANAAYFSRPYAYRGEVALADVRDGEYRTNERECRGDATCESSFRVEAVEKRSRSGRSDRERSGNSKRIRRIRRIVEFVAESMRRSDERVGERVATRSIALDRLTVTRFTRLLRA